MKKILIIGAGGFAREVAGLIEDINKNSKEWNLIGFIDENSNNHGKVLNKYPVLGDFSYLDNLNFYEPIYCVCAVGNPRIKIELINKLKKRMPLFTNLIHPSVIMSNCVEIGFGNIICAGTIITTNVRIGNYVAINPASAIGHDVVIDDYSTILWKVNIAGNVSIGVGCEIGTNTTIIQGISIGSWSIIGAGAVVVREIPSNCTAVGVPAKPIKFNRG